MRAKLDGALHKFTALMIASARLGPPGTAAQGTPPVPMPSVVNASWPEPGQGPGSVRPQLRPGPLVGPADGGPDQDEDGLYAPIPRESVYGFPHFHNVEHQQAFSIDGTRRAAMPKHPEDRPPDRRRRGQSPGSPLSRGSEPRDQQLHADCSPWEEVTVLPPQPFPDAVTPLPEPIDTDIRDQELLVAIGTPFEEPVDSWTKR